VELMSAPAVELFDSRARELSMLGPRGWFLDHSTHSMACACTAQGPDPTCDLGVALFRLAKSARADENQRRRA
jgi:hypothetical protein